MEKKDNYKIEVTFKDRTDVECSYEPCSRRYRELFDLYNGLDSFVMIKSFYRCRDNFNEWSTDYNEGKVIKYDDLTEKDIEFIDKKIEEFMETKRGSNKRWDCPYWLVDASVEEDKNDNATIGFACVDSNEAEVDQRDVDDFRGSVRYDVEFEENIPLRMVASPSEMTDEQWERFFIMFVKRLESLYEKYDDRAFCEAEERYYEREYEDY